MRVPLLVLICLFGCKSPGDDAVEGPSPDGDPLSCEEGPSVIDRMLDQARACDGPEDCELIGGPVDCSCQAALGPFAVARQQAEGLQQTLDAWADTCPEPTTCQILSIASEVYVTLCRAGRCEIAGHDSFCDSP